MDDCVFCNIINRTIESQILFEDDQLVVIKDILPKAPVHLLIIPKKHILSVAHLDAADQALAGDMILQAKNMAEKFGVNETGYKLVFNVGRDGGQVIAHLHLHLLGGKKFAE
ncbi:MAG TPA: histidine triad nucleotide-binding protein [Patescibacteria group bacterium]|nr:histidine triad nucleotide-binding protein [Patescibacteria group bacterium]